MHLLTPSAVVWLGSLPILLWIWRLASTRRTTPIPSLVPFEHLLARPPRRHSRLAVNLLFWLQLAALIGLALALMQPVVSHRPARRILVVLDTSASMEATDRRGSAFARATRALLARLARKRPTDEIFIMTTAPVAALTAQPTSDLMALTQAVRGAQVSHLGGNLSTTARIGRALLETAPDALLLVSDEPAPEAGIGERVQMLSVGERLPNVAIVGVDAQGPLCSPADARVVVTVQNFSTEPAPVAVAARHHGQRVSEAAATIAPRMRQAVALTMPEAVEGWIAVTVDAPRDPLPSDNTAWVAFHRKTALPLVIQSAHPSFVQTIGSWLDACEALTWTETLPPESQPALLITDRDGEASDAAEATLRFLPPATPQPTLSYWVAASDHPIGAYLSPVDVVSASLNLTPGVGATEAPVISALVDGRKLPVVTADERQGRRSVTLRFAPEGSRHSTPVLVAFFNSLRWLMGASQPLRVGEGKEAPVGVNLFDPIESNLLERASTWIPTTEGETFRPSSTTSREAQGSRNLAYLLMLLLLILMLVEWRLYCRGARGEGRGAT